MRGCALPKQNFAERPRGCGMMPKPKKRHCRGRCPIGMAMRIMRKLAPM